MDIRNHQDENIRSQAVFSDCGLYRYALTREWGVGKRVMFVMLNPSTADERKNDPTVERCERRARAWGYGAFRVTNLFAFRATDPRDLKSAKHPEGPQNRSALIEGARWADLVLCGWGTHGQHLGQGEHIRDLLSGNGVGLWHLGLTKHGLPRHPLYVAYSVSPQFWC